MNKTRLFVLLLLSSLFLYSCSSNSYDIRKEDVYPGYVSVYVMNTDSLLIAPYYYYCIPIQMARYNYADAKITLNDLEKYKTPDFKNIIAVFKNRSAVSNQDYIDTSGVYVYKIPKNRLSDSLKRNPRINYWINKINTEFSDYANKFNTMNWAKPIEVSKSIHYNYLISPYRQGHIFLYYALKKIMVLDAANKDISDQFLLLTGSPDSYLRNNYKYDYSKAKSIFYNDMDPRIKEDLTYYYSSMYDQGPAFSSSTLSKSIFGVSPIYGKLSNIDLSSYSLLGLGSENGLLFVLVPIKDVSNYKGQTVTIRLVSKSGKYSDYKYTFK